ncbi:unnamed protein product [Allacma fusca]|uniref:EF-hand domain-containing protein n=1 Tax=Allacma fusca TaxID=39272 RepID=A0A8J2Q6G7_9HEXA|nr:unnamed protein product [Allacma fusca]
MPSENVNVEAKQNLMNKLFRRSSLTPSWEEGKIKASAMATILNQMGQKVDELELNRLIARLDRFNTGTLDYDAYTKICERFLTDPAAIERGAGDQFAFKHLITLNDFATP